MYILPNRHFIKALTLIELLIAISVSVILFGVVTLMFQSSLDSFMVSQEDLHLQKAIDDILTEITGEGFDFYGIIDAVDFIKFSDAGVKFIPLWIDQPKNKDNKRYILTKPVQAGRSSPLVEVKLPYSDEFKPRSAAFYAGKHSDPVFNDDIIEFENSLPMGSKVRAIYVPDKSASSVVFNLNWDKKKGVLTREYNNKISTIPAYPIEGVTIKDVRFKYFDNTNTLIPGDLFPFVTAIQAQVTVDAQGKTREGIAFINIRNTRTSGAGIIIRQGTRIKIPDSFSIRTFSISNITKITDGGFVEIEAIAESGETWKLIMELGFKDGHPLIKDYSVEYPVGQVAYSETINMWTDLSFNLLTLGSNGRYDYDDDLGSEDVVLLEGDVELVVTRMDAEAASLYVRP